MAWKQLPTNYTDVTYNGLKKYRQVNNSDGTISFQDVTQYTNRENSFFGAKDANNINTAVNTIIGMVEGGNNLYTNFNNYFEQQKTAFQQRATQLENANQTQFNQWFNATKNTLNSSTGGQIITRLDQQQTKINAIEQKIGSAKLRRVNTSGQEVSNGDYLQAFNPLLNTWEWVNFPNTVNVEYQTVERFNGKPLFVKWIETTLPDAGSKTLTIANNSMVVRTNLHHYYYGATLPRSIPYIVKNTAILVNVAFWGANVDIETLVSGWNNARVAGHVYYIKL